MPCCLKQTSVFPSCGVRLASFLSLQIHKINKPLTALANANDQSLSIFYVSARTPQAFLDVGNKQVSWLRKTIEAPHYSSGTAPDFHRLPFYASLPGQLSAQLKRLFPIIFS